MNLGLYLLIPTLVVIVASVLIVRAGAVALRMTGLDDKTARFQALSAFTRAGFTTRESEIVVSHPQRRAIISWLIVLGNAGIVAVIVTATSSLATSPDYRLAIVIGALLLGAFIVYKLAQHAGLTRRWEDFVERRLVRGRLFSPGRRLEHLLRLAEGFGVARMVVIGDGRKLRDKLLSRDLVILGVERQDAWIPGAKSDLPIKPGDFLVLYGRLGEMEKILNEGI
jgi:hypothetical protein